MDYLTMFLDWEKMLEILKTRNNIYLVSICRINIIRLIQNSFINNYLLIPWKRATDIRAA